MILKKMSLKSRVTLLTLAIFLLSIWVLTLYVDHFLREDMRRVLVDQQFSTASFMASEVNRDLRDRMEILEDVAKSVPEAWMLNNEPLSSFLSQRQAIQRLFNHGTVITDAQGITIASFPFVKQRMGINYGDRDFIISALKEGKSTVGRPVMGRVTKVRLFTISVPIRNKQGRVIGTLSGTTNLALPSFLDNFSANSYGKTGGYLIVDARHRTVVTASDKGILNGDFPPPGVNPVIDSFINGYEGSAIFTTPRGGEVLSSVKGIPVAGWYVSVQLPTKEAFAPINVMQEHILLAAIGLSLLAGSLTWWVLRRQLAPLVETARTLAEMAQSDHPPRALPVTRQDEVGALVSGFNRLLAILNERENLLRIEGKHRIAAQREAKKADVLLREAVASMVPGLVIFDPDDRLVVCNEAYRSFYDVSRDLLVPGGQFETLLRQGIERGQFGAGPERDEAWVADRMDKHRQGTGESIEQNLSNGLTVLINERRTPSGYIVGSRIDITHLKRVEFELIAARDVAETANRAKSEFLASMSHELRTPLNAVLGFAQLLATDPDLSLENRDNASEIERAGMLLLGLISQILDLSRVETGQMEIHLEPVALRSLAGQCFPLVSGQAQAEGIQLIDAGGDGRDCLIDADPMRLQQVVLNFLSNAIKYNRPSGIARLSYELRQTTERKAVRIVVSDTGLGIAADKQDRVFSAFDRLGREAGNIEGTGIGLLITRRIVEAMGGMVGFSSTEGQGSTFWAEFTVTG